MEGLKNVQKVFKNIKRPLPKLTSDDMVSVQPMSPEPEDNSGTTGTDRPS